MSERKTYLTNGQLREEIVYTVGGDPTRYGIDSKRGLKKADTRQIAETLQPENDETEIHNLELRALYESVCSWADGEYQPNSGNVWGLNRKNLKKIHAAVDARPPREKPGREQTPQISSQTDPNQ